MKAEDKKTEKREKVVIFLVVLLILLTAILIAVFLLFIIDDVPKAVFVPQSDEEKLNFTDADVACKAIYGPNGRLFVPENEDEEEVFLNEYFNQPDDYYKACPKTFIGLRVKILEKMGEMSSKKLVLPIEMAHVIGGIATASPETSSPEIPEGFQCSLATFTGKEEEHLNFTTVECPDKYGCVLCEIIPIEAYANGMGDVKRCPRNYPNCYIVRFPDTGAEDYNVLKNMCDEVGRIAIVSKDGLTYNQKTRIHKTSCRDKLTVMLSSALDSVIESLNGVKMKHKSKHIEKGISMDNCLVVTNDKPESLQYERCFAKNCYACQIKRS